jgi:hypothetical protein
MATLHGLRTQLADKATMQSWQILRIREVCVERHSPRLGYTCQSSSTGARTPTSTSKNANANALSRIIFVSGIYR